MIYKVIEMMPIIKPELVKKIALFQLKIAKEFLNIILKEIKNEFES